MKELVRTSAAIIGGEEQQTVNARELWKALKSKQQFGNWITDRLSGFADGRDYLINKTIKQVNSGKKYLNEYAITLDVAKHLAMLERNEQGQKIRDYFIAVEKEYRRRHQTSENLPSGLDTALVVQHVAKILIPFLEERAKDKAKIEFSRNFLPLGNPGDLNKNGEHKTQFRRGYYCAGKGRNITALVERMEQPGLFDEIHLERLPTAPGVTL